MCERKERQRWHILKTPAPPQHLLPCHPPHSTQDPVATPAGYLYSKEAILKCLLDQKQEAKRRLAAWEAAGAAEVGKEAAAAAADRSATLLAFERQATAGASDALAASIRDAVKADAAADGAPKRLTSVSAIASNRERAAGLRANWGVTAANAPEAPAVRGPKPDTLTRCPASGRPLRMKELIAVRFTRDVKEEEEEGEGGAGGPGKPHEVEEEGRDAPFAVDPITRDPLTNASALVLIKPTGDVMLKATYDACVKPDGRLGGTAVRHPEDVIPLRSGGTGFAGHAGGGGVEAKKTFALGPGTGRADVRGQGGVGGSKFGLRFNN